MQSTCKSFFFIYFKNRLVSSLVLNPPVFLNFTGFGAPVPRTTIGRTVGVIFAAIGIPAHFLLILNFGVMVALRLQKYALVRRGARLDNAEISHFTMPRWVKILPFICSGKYSFRPRRQLLSHVNLYRNYRKCSFYRSKYNSYLAIY